MSTKQFITFRLDDRLIGLDILKVREINRLLDITPVQHSPVHVRGLINLRGQAVCVIDLGTRLGLEPRTMTDLTHNVILKDEAVGLLVDSIGDVEEATGEEMEAPPANLGPIGTEFMECVVKLRDELLVVLSPDKILEPPADRGGFA
jgi:purine-binding chemotaxis protein CheW